MTGADIERMVKDARRKARREKRAMILADLRGALVDEDDRPAELRYRSCIHEASHIIVDVIHNGPDDVFATAAPVGSRFGASVRTNRTQRAGTYDEYRRMLEVILAGRVGEELILGAGSHGAGGEAGSDLDRATAMAAAMAGSFGLAGASPLVYLGAAKNSRDFMAFEDIRVSVRKELESAATSCRELLERHRDGVKAVAGRLVERGRVDGADVARILERTKTALKGEDSL
jgi:cell division protease FtsH